MNLFSSIEVCAGAGGQAIGLERAGFDHRVLIEVEQLFCDTLSANRPNWNVVRADLNYYDGTQHKNIDLFSGGVPCPPFSVAGKQLGSLDERDLFPAALRLINEIRPRAVMLENVRGLLSPKFEGYRAQITSYLENMGYKVNWKLLHAADFGVAQLRPRTILVALQPRFSQHFSWPEVSTKKRVTVGEVLYEEMASNGWKGVKEWSVKASSIAPTLVGGSKKHGGADLGPTRAKLAWSFLGVDGKGLADSAPDRDFIGNPRLTVSMAAQIQGFPKEWKFSGRKTAAYRQVGNAFPPPVAEAVGTAIRRAIEMGLKQDADLRKPAIGQGRR